MAPVARARKRPTGASPLIAEHPATEIVVRAVEPPSAIAELSADQTACEVEVLEPVEALVPVKRPSLVPEWVPKLQTMAAGAALFFAAVAVVVERHEQRYHHDEPNAP